MKLIIVNADDLGMDVATNDAIFAGARAGRLTSATVLANGAGVEDAARRIREYPRISYGAHLNATDWSPLTGHPGLRPILDETGRFRARGLWERPVSGELREALFVEWSAQIGRLLDLGFPVGHFDSHHHAHTVPGVFPVLVRLRRRFGIRKMRASMNLYSATIRQRSSWLLPKKWIWNRAVRLAGFKTADVFTALECFCDVADTGPVAGRVVELMVHPGAALPAGEAAAWAGDRLAKTPFPYKLINYNEF